LDFGGMTRVFKGTVVSIPKRLPQISRRPMTAIPFGADEIVATAKTGVEGHKRLFNQGFKKVEPNLAKVGVEGSNPFARSKFP